MGAEKKERREEGWEEGKSKIASIRDREDFQNQHSRYCQCV